jgi:UMF1 family MFS transporter
MNRNTSLDKTTLAWALYDWANSAFSVTVISAFFPLMLKRFWSPGDDSTQSTFELGIANAIGSVVIAVLSPVLGAIADRGGTRKRDLLVFAAIAIVMTGALSLVARGEVALAIALYVLANIGFSASVIYYDALLVDVAPEPNWHRVSALGFALGYLGGGVLFAANVAMTLAPQLFGLSDATAAIRASFLTVAGWWAVFSLPLLWYVHEPRQTRVSARAAIGASLRRLSKTLHELRRFRPAALFLLAYWLYIDGVGTIARMAVDYGTAIGLGERHLIVALLITQFVGFPASIVYGRLGIRFGVRRAIAAGIAVYVAVTVWSYLMTAAWEFYVLASVVGLVQGGVQALSRSLFAHMVPASKAAEFFGFYNMLGKFAAIVGPLLIGVVALWTGSSRTGLLSIIVMFIAGGLLLLAVDETEGARAAREWDAARRALP